MSETTVDFGMNKEFRGSGHNMTDIGRITIIIHEVVHPNLFAGNNIEDNLYGGYNQILRN